MWFDDPPARRKKSTKRKKTSRGKGKKSSRSSRSTLLQVKGKKKSSRSRKSTSGGHRKPALTVLLILVFAGLVWVLVSGTRLLANTLYADNDAFLIDLVQVSNPGGRLQSTHVTDYAGISDLDNLFALSLKEIHQNLEAVPLVRKVKVGRELPGTLHITIEERTPLARIGLETRGYHLSVDVGGVVLGPSAQTPFLPAITGIRRMGLRPGHQIESDRFLDALELIDISRTAGLNQQLQIAFIDIGHAEHLDLRLENNARIIFPLKDKEGRLRKLSDMMYEATRRGEVIEFADLTVRKNIPARFATAR